MNKSKTPQKKPLTYQIAQKSKSPLSQNKYHSKVSLSQTVSMQNLQKQKKEYFDVKNRYCDMQFQLPEQGQIKRDEKDNKRLFKQKSKANQFKKILNDLDNKTKSTNKFFTHTLMQDTEKNCENRTCFNNQMLKNINFNSDNKVNNFHNIQERKIQQLTPEQKQNQQTKQTILKYDPSVEKSPIRFQNQKIGILKEAIKSVKNMDISGSKQFTNYINRQEQDDVSKQSMKSIFTYQKIGEEIQQQIQNLHQQQKNAQRNQYNEDYKKQYQSRNSEKKENNQSEQSHQLKQNQEYSKSNQNPLFSYLQSRIEFQENQFYQKNQFNPLSMDQEQHRTKERTPDTIAIKNRRKQCEFQKGGKNVISQKYLNREEEKEFKQNELRIQQEKLKQYEKLKQKQDNLMNLHQNGIQENGINRIARSKSQIIRTFDSNNMKQALESSPNARHNLNTQYQQLRQSQNQQRDQGIFIRQNQTPDFSQQQILRQRDFIDHSPIVQKEDGIYSFQQKFPIKSENQFFSTSQTTSKKFTNTYKNESQFKIM